MCLFKKNNIVHHKSDASKFKLIKLIFNKNITNINFQLKK